MITFVLLDVLLEMLLQMPKIIIQVTRESSAGTLPAGQDH